MKDGVIVDFYLVVLNASPKHIFGDRLNVIPRVKDTVTVTNESGVVYAVNWIFSEDEETKVNIYLKY